MVDEEDKKVATTEDGGRRAVAEEENKEFSYLTRVGRDLDSLFGRFPWAVNDVFAPRFLGVNRIFNNHIGHDENEKEITYSFNVAGVDKKDIAVNITKGLLNVDAKDDSHEYRYQVSVDDIADTEHVVAEYDKGILKVVMPKLSEDHDKQEITIR